ncbi:ATP-binding protein [Clostridiales bacterium COT073_COT-073]|nr:ATP-binding protein [Clostridiales bacterium COT073_COT-073]
MIVMDLRINNLFGFEDFKVNFSYPKKIVNSLIENEFLTSKPSFRFKKLNILIGANASGKTSMGKALMKIFNFISRKDISGILEVIKDKSKSASFSIDFLCDEEVMYRVRCLCRENADNTEESVDLEVYSTKILKKDSYESCVKKLQLMYSAEEQSRLSYAEKLKLIKSFGWLFTFPDSGSKLLLDENEVVDLKILKAILQTLDSHITNVNKSKEVKNGYVIRSKNGDVFIQNGEVVDKNILSSGTQMGIDIAYVLSSIQKNSHGFYFCDEKFSFIQTDVEQAILSLMVSLLKPNSQLFFTSHNIDLLEMGFPRHSFTFLRKNSIIEAVYPDKLIKKNDVSLRNVFKNDLFGTAPDISKLFAIEEGVDE